MLSNSHYIAEKVTIHTNSTHTIFSKIDYQISVCIINALFYAVKLFNILYKKSKSLQTSITISYLKDCGGIHIIFIIVYYTPPTTVLYLFFQNAHEYDELPVRHNEDHLNR